MKPTAVIWLITLLFINLLSFSQEIKVENKSLLKDYPLVTLDVAIRNPKIKQKKDFLIKENDSIVPFQLTHLGVIEPENKIQNILILVENLNQLDSLEFYKEVLKNSIENLKTKHKINIGIFDRVRNQGTQSVFLLLPNFTNDIHKLLQAISQFQPKNDVFGNNKSSDLYLSVYEGINILKNKENPKTLILLSTAFNNKWSSHTSSESAKAFAIKNNIPVYSLQFRKQGFEHHRLTDLVGETYGKELITNDIEKGTLFINSTINNLNKRLGNKYQISYHSIYKKNGKAHNSSLIFNNNTIKYQVKSKNIKQWYYYLIGLLFFIILVYFGYKYTKNQRQLSKEKLALLDQEIKQEQQKNKAFKHSLQEQNNILSQINSAKEAKLHNEKLLKKEAEIFVQMKIFEALPIIQYTTNGIEQSYIIKKSTIFIGRAPTNDIVLTDKQISRTHAKIIFENGYYILDLQSATGIKVNKKQATKTELKHGNIIQIGNTQLTFIL